MDSSGDRQFIQLRNLFYDILDKLSKAYEELKTGKSDAQTEELLVKIANLCTDIQKNSLNAVALSADTNKQYLKIIPYIERMNRILDVVAERYNMSKAPVKPTTIKGWILWVFKRLWSWIDRYVGFFIFISIFSKKEAPGTAEGFFFHFSITADTTVILRLSSVTGGTFPARRFIVSAA